MTQTCGCQWICTVQYLKYIHSFPLGPNTNACYDSLSMLYRIISCFIKSRVLSIHNLHVWFTSNGYEWIKYWWRGGYHTSNVHNSRDMQYVLMFIISLLCCSRAISILRFICLWETSDDHLKMAGDFEPCRYTPGIQEDVLDLCYCKRWCWSSEWDANRRILHREAHLPWGSAYCSKESQ